MLVPNVNVLTVRAPAIAQKIQPGQFIILRVDDYSERMPLTVADWDREAGTITCIFMQVGTSTQKLGATKPGDRLPTFVGPLGHPLELENFGTVIISTFDGSKPGKKGEGPVHLADLLASGRHIDRIFALGCTFMMYETAKATRPFGIKTIVSLNPIMIDGTGMCGACRVVVGGETRFACVDGPDFDAHQIDWEVLLSRRRPYIEAETSSLENYK
jgi:ferredoxin--NADP+ reductase